MPGSLKLIRSYYLATPVFILIDSIWGANLRIVGLEGHPELKYLYYLLCLGFGAATYLHLRWTVWIALLESSANVLLLILSIYLPMFRLMDSLFTDQPIANPFTPELVTNFIVAGGIWTFAFYSNLPAWGVLGHRAGPPTLRPPGL